MSFNQTEYSVYDSVDSSIQEEYKKGYNLREYNYLVTILGWIDLSLELISKVRNKKYCFFTDIQKFIDIVWESDIILPNISKLLGINRHLWRLEWHPNPQLNGKLDLMFFHPLNALDKQARKIKLKNNLKFMIREIQINDLQERDLQKKIAWDWEPGFEPFCHEIPNGPLPKFQPGKYAFETFSVSEEEAMSRKPAFNFLLKDIHPPLKKMPLSAGAIDLLKTHTAFEQVVGFMAAKNMCLERKQIFDVVRVCFQIEMSHEIIMDLNELCPQFYNLLLHSQEKPLSLLTFITATDRSQRTEALLRKQFKTQYEMLCRNKLQ